ncbi:peptide chain release factor H [Tenacibaculum discolor]|uniref:Peptide chain release factor H n=1 Tax=Tenacibaculum discolor TaxID=361581 RepID=A0A2G1BX19_9FLAO|nr:peptide chain release factor H [Tenacibaculum discolor]MDP2540607.1 peptide chain release factor H [Tenacibaculum discolor]PHN98566.1 peptide chain release factor H [Tenacibaculum discolor]PHO00375.1 peptide chain release factor H [Rhodobacteraceae bacterium 4F10]
MDIKIIQFTAGRGPSECCWVVAKVLKAFIKAVVEHKIMYDILHKEKGIENGTIQSVSVQLKGNNLSLFLKDWMGTIQWIGKSTFRKYHKRKNWFIGCFELEYNNELTIQEKDIEFQAIRSSGPGGQHVNKVSSAVRAKHSTTGIQVLVSESRSQHQNKKIAVQRLKTLIANHNINQLQNTIKQEWENHIDLERGNPVKVFVGTDFKVKNNKKRFKTTRNQLKSDLRKQL